MSDRPLPHRGRWLQTFLWVLRDWFPHLRALLPYCVDEKPVLTCCHAPASLELHLAHSGSILDFLKWSRGKSVAAAPSDLADAAVRIFFGIARAWQLTEEEQMKLLGITSCTTLRSWRDGQVSELTQDTIERVSFLLGIFKAINILLPEQGRADAWVRASNKAPPFRGRSALDRMTRGNISDLRTVRQYLDAQLA